MAPVEPHVLISDLKFLSKEDPAVSRYASDPITSVLIKDSQKSFEKHGREGGLKAARIEVMWTQTNICFRKQGQVLRAAS